MLSRSAFRGCLMADSCKIDSLLRLIVLMQQDRAGNASDLARTLGVVNRTVHRYLETLRELGVPWYFDDETKRYRISREFFLPPLQLTAGEALALLALGRNLGGSEQIALTAPAARAVEKIRGQLPSRVLAELADLDARIDVRIPATGPDTDAIRDVFGTIQQAIAARRAIRCRYESPNGGSDGDAFMFRPYALSFDQRAWYVIGHHDRHNEVRRLKLTRFAAICLTDKPYAIPDDFSVEAFRGKAWRMIRGDGVVRRIVIDFEPMVADTVSETNWHPTQHVELHDDGSITFTCDVEGLDEIVWWVLGYGPHARVREPRELAEQVRQLALATTRRYDGA